MKTSLILLALAAFTTVGAIDNQDQQAQKFLKKRGGIKVHHWVLAQPKGHPITSLDIAKRLEVVFYQSYPEYVTSQQARLQFYQQAWPQMLADQIDNQLMMFDAEDKKVKVADGDIRQELEERFGPNVVGTIDELGLSYHEAVEMVREDLVVQQMRGAMISSKAHLSVTPEKLRGTYDQFAEEFEPTDTCKYQILTIRHSNPEIAKKASAIADQLAKEGLSLEKIYDKLDDDRRAGKLAGTLSIRVSELEERPIPTLAAAYRDVLSEMEVGTTSGAVAQESRSGDGVYRLYHLATWTSDKLPEFEEVVDDIFSMIYQQAYQEQQMAYLGRLRQQYGITEAYLSSMMPDDFSPFSL